MEYEYSYKVSDLKEYIEYLNNNFICESKAKEIRTIYRKEKIIARITIRDNKMYLDFKENIISNKDLVTRKESKEIEFHNLENCEDILLFLGFIKDNTLVRTRTIYKGKKIKFEVDEYEKPEKAFVISFEGDKSTCDNQYKELDNLNKKYKI